MLLAGVICHRLYFWLVARGVGVHFNEHFPGDCKTIPGISCGSEKIVVTKRAPNEGLAFITNGFKLMSNCNPKFTQGNIYTFDFNHPGKGANKLAIQPSESLDLAAFDPHGMDLLEESNGNIKVYIVNHAKHVETVEVFLYVPTQPGSIKHLKTIRHEKFICLNDLTLFGEDVFYITNFFKYCHYPFVISATEFLLGLETGNVVYYDNGKAEVMAEGLSYNGISQSIDGKEVVVNAGGTTFLEIFDRVKSTGQLKFKQKVNLFYFPDNVFTDYQTGDYYVGVQKKILKLIALFKNQSRSAPSTGVRVYKKDGSYTVEEVFHDSGHSYVQGVSSLAHFKGQYLLGTVFHNLGYCQTN